MKIPDKAWERIWKEFDNFNSVWTVYSWEESKQKIQELVNQELRRGE